MVEYIFQFILDTFKNLSTFLSWVISPINFNGVSIYPLALLTAPFVAVVFGFKIYHLIVG